MRRTKCVLIIGGSGFIGSQLALKLRDTYKVFATYKNHALHLPGISYLPFDVYDRNWIKRIVYNTEPDVIVYIAGNNGLEWCEKNARDADRIHTGGAASVSTVASILQPKFIYLSNAYVFDGKKGNYREDDTVLPWSALGKAKLGGENYIKGRSLNYLILRSSPVFGRSNGVNLSTLDHLRMKLSIGQKVEFSNTELHSYAPAHGLVDLLERLVDSGPRNKILHYGGLTKVTPYEFAVEFAKRFKFDPNLVQPIRLNQPEHLSGPTEDYSLNSTEVSRTLKIKPLLLEEGFDLLEKKVVAGP